MKRIIALLFVAAALATAFAPVGFANNGGGVDNNGDPGRYDNCTGLNQNDGNAFEQGQGWHAAYYCFG